MEVIRPGCVYKGACRACGCVIGAMPSEVFQKRDSPFAANYALCPACNSDVTVYRVEPIDYKPAEEKAAMLFRDVKWKLGTYWEWEAKEDEFKKEIFESHPDFCLKCSAVHAPKEGCK